MRNRIRRLNFFSRASLLTNKILPFKSSKLKDKTLDPAMLSEGARTFRASCILAQSTLACDATDFIISSILSRDFKNRSNHSTMYYSAYESIDSDTGWCPIQYTFDSTCSAYFTAESSSSVSDVGAHNPCIPIPDSTELYLDDWIRRFPANYLSVSHRHQPQQQAREFETSANDDDYASSNNGPSLTRHDADEIGRVHSAADGYRYVLVPDATAPSVAHLSSMSSISLQAHRVFETALADEDHMVCFGIGRRARYYIALVMRSIGKSVVSAINSSLRAVGLVGSKVRHILLCSILCFVVYASGPPV
ncbi:hypothetical protein V1525DRAFT_400599 [Lipomyces kononenkoae]|uniref:Uncharacterized protein n=1 Tax=Lipomyces kononenkoae TaxID=34357 RepID=A0ACC3T416_LIPKO